MGDDRRFRGPGEASDASPVYLGQLAPPDAADGFWSHTASLYVLLRFKIVIAEAP